MAVRIGEAWAAAALGVLVAVAAAAAGCGDAGTDGADAAADLESVEDAARRADGGAATDGAVNRGQLLVAGAFELLGITSEDDLIVIDRGEASIAAYPLSGGPAQVLVRPATVVPVIRDNVVFAWTASGGYGLAPLLVWTAETGSEQLSSLAVAGVADSDGEHLLWCEANSDFNHCELRVARVDGSHPVAIGQAFIGTAPCRQIASRFLHSKSSAALIVSYCDEPQNGVPGARQLRVVTPDRGALIARGTGGEPPVIDADEAGGLGVVLDDQGALVVIDPDDGPSPLGQPDPADDAAFFPGGGGFAYHSPGAAPAQGRFVAFDAATRSLQAFATGGGRFLRARRQEGARPALLDPPGSAQLASRYALIGPPLGPGDSFTPIYRARLDGQVVPLVDTPTGALLGDAFTGDGKSVLYFTECRVAFAGSVGKLVARPVEGGAAVPVTAKNTYSWTVRALGGSRLVWNDGYTGGPFHGRADLRAGDAATGRDGATLIAEQAEADFFVSRARDKVAYAVTGDASSGIYVYDLR